MDSNSGSEFYLKPLPHFDKKWVKANLELALRQPEVTAALWNYLLANDELNTNPNVTLVNSKGAVSYLDKHGFYYCGTTHKWDYYCSPATVCFECFVLKDKDGTGEAGGGGKKKPAAVNQAAGSVQSGTNENSEDFIESWIWGPIPTTNEKFKFLQALLREQQETSHKAARNCLSTVHLRQRLCIFERYLIALGRFKAAEKGAECMKESFNDTNLSLQSCSRSSTLTRTSKNRLENATLGLARVGTSAALNFSFAFLRRAWRSGEDIELCSELLLEALVSIQELPEATLFDSSRISQLWLDLLERTLKFLKQVVLGDVMGARCGVPKEDCFTALNLLLELNAQKGDLSSTLDGIFLLLTLWEKEKNTDDNRTSPENLTAPILPILRRYEKISNADSPQPASQNESFSTNPNESFLRFFALPEQDSALIDLKQAAVVVISHLDRLAAPHFPINNNIRFNGMPNLFQDHQSQAKQKVFSFGLFESDCFDNNGDTRPFVALSESIGFRKIVRNSVETMVLCENDQIRSMFDLATKSEILKIGSHPILDISGHPDGRYFVTLNSINEVVLICSTEEAANNADERWTNVKTGTWYSKIEIPEEKKVVQVFCGVNSSVAICENGEVFYWAQKTWGFPEQISPKCLESLTHLRIKKFAFGCPGVSNTLCVTGDGAVHSFEDGDLSKLSSANGPVFLDVFTVPIKAVWVGVNITVVLSENGKVYTWGRGQDGQLGHGNFSDQAMPKIVEALDSKIIVDISLGVVHCLALSLEGELFGWGRNDFHQICPTSHCSDVLISSPLLILPSIRVSGIFTNQTQSIVWCQSAHQILSPRIPFVVDLCKHTFHLLDQLLGMVLSSATYSDGRQLPNQESECIAVASLNLLRLQLYTLILNKISPDKVGLGGSSNLLESLKLKILNLAGCSNILKTIQEAAQSALEIGWSVLLPTASERAQTLTSLLPSGLDSNVSSSGHRFMTDLLVGSLMAEDGLQTALNQAILNSDSDHTGGDSNLPLLHLIKQLLRNNTSTTQTRLSQIVTGNFVKNENKIGKDSGTSPSLELLHRFQRLLFSSIITSTSSDVNGAESLLEKYVHQVITLSTGTLTRAAEVAGNNRDSILESLKNDVSDTVLYELVIGLILLHRNRDQFLGCFEWKNVFIPLIKALDNLNRSLAETEVQESNDMGWPGILSRSNNKPGLQAINTQKETLQIRQTDLENHILDEGEWIIVNGNVYDIKNYQPEHQTTVDVLKTGIGKDLTNELTNGHHKGALEYILENLFVGKFTLNETEAEKKSTRSTTLITHLSTERALAYLMGQMAGLMQKGPDLQLAETQCRNLLNNVVLSAGLQVLQPSNPFDEEKGEARSSASTAGSTPTDHSNHISSHETRNISGLMKNVSFGLYTDFCKFFLIP